MDRIWKTGTKRALGSFKDKQTKSFEISKTFERSWYAERNITPWSCFSDDSKLRSTNIFWPPSRDHANRDFSAYLPKFLVCFLRKDVALAGRWSLIWLLVPNIATTTRPHAALQTIIFGHDNKRALMWRISPSAFTELERGTAVHGTHNDYLQWYANDKRIFLCLSVSLCLSVWLSFCLIHVLKWT